MNPFFIELFHAECSVCHGTGFKKSIVCSYCDGMGFTDDDEVEENSVDVGKEQPKQS